MFITNQDSHTVQISICEKCIKIANESDTSCQKCGSELTKENIEPEIYVPIEFSNAKLAIPMGESIIYSTLCRVDYVVLHKYSWNSHLLMTPKGFGFSFPLDKDFPTPPTNYVSWLDVRSIGANFEAGALALTPTKFSLINDPKFESKETFKKRINVFDLKILPFMIGLRKKMLYCIENDIYQKEFEDRDIPRWKKILIKQIAMFEKLYEKRRKKVK